MTTTLERLKGKQVPPFGRIDNGYVGRDDKRYSWFGPEVERRQNDKARVWAATCATGGAAVWAGMAVLARVGIARMGAIELLFLLGPLVIVPLGMELGREMGGDGRLEEIARRLQPLGAALAVGAMWFGPGRRAGLFAVGWLVVCGLVAGTGLVGLVRALKGD